MRPLPPAPDAHPVAFELFRRMREASIGQKALAARAGLNETYVRDLLRGRSRNPKADHLAKLAAALNCRVEDLIDPGGTGRAPQVGDRIDDPDEAALISFWRSLTAEGRERFLGALAAAAPGAAKRA